MSKGPDVRADDVRQILSPGHHDDLLPVVVEDLRLAFGGQPLLCGISLTIETPGVTVIMGPNGAGKSLLLRCLHGLLTPTGGTIRWGEHSVTPALQRRQAMVFQRPVLLRRSVLANLHFAQKTRQIIDDANAFALLRAMRLHDISERPARKLSGGEQQRLALARALATRPDVLFLDEPTASLDPASTRIIEDTVTAAAAQGLKVVFVTHNVHQAQRLANDVVFLADGKVCEHRPSANFFAAPSSPQADAYLTGRLPEI